jgi:hypothetical protein
MTMDEEVTRHRMWLRSKARMITLYAGAFAAVLGGILGWQQLGLPVPATQSDMVELRQEIGSNTKLILGDRWLRLTAQIKQLEAQLARDPGNRRLIERLVRLQQQLREVEKGLQ